MSKPLHKLINEKYQIWAALHMTHINNLQSILRAKEIKSKNLLRGQKYYNLANDDVQVGRAAISVPVSNRPLHDYVPLYLGFKTPMLAVNQDKNEEVLYIRFSLDILATPGTVICDGNARSKASKFYEFTGPDIFSKLDIKAIRSVKYSKDPEQKRKKQSEVLIPDTLPVTQVFDIICYSEKAKTRTLSILAEFGINKPVTVNLGWYFINTSKDGSKEDK